MNFLFPDRRQKKDEIFGFIGERYGVTLVNSRERKFRRKTRRTDSSAHVIFVFIRAFYIVIACTKKHSLFG